jgi:nitroreductase
MTISAREGADVTMIELLRQRRSIRKYGEKPPGPEQVQLLAEALLRAPSSRNIDPWEFVIIDDRQLLTQLASAKQHGSDFLRGAALGIVVCADSTKSDVWVEDCSIAAILAQLTAQSLGLGSCWIQIRNRFHRDGTSSEAFIQKLLGLPEHVKVECIISIGTPGEQRPGLAADKLQYDKLRRNGYTERWRPAED